MSSFMGIPVEGEPNHSRSKQADQLPIEALSPFIQAVLDDENAGDFGWSQYTPYFNDGDECVFGINELWANPANATIEDDDYKSGFRYDDRWFPEGIDWRTRKDSESLWPDTFARLSGLDDAIQSGQYDDALYDAFGDHCEVTFSKGKITVNEYEHD